MTPFPPRSDPDRANLDHADSDRTDSSGQDEETAALLRDVLRRRAETIHPSADGLERILRAVHAASASPDGPGPGRNAPARNGSAAPLLSYHPPLPASQVPGRPESPMRWCLTRWPTVLVAAAVTVLLSTSLGLARLSMVNARELDTAVGSPPVVSRTTLPEPLPVYLVEWRGQRWVLVRKLSPTALTDPTERLRAALQLAVISEGNDPEHTSMWRAAGVPVSTAKEITTTSGPDGLVIRLPGTLLGPGPRGAASVTTALIAVQQLVWTATATTQDMAPVRIEGPTAGSVLFGSLTLGRHFERGDSGLRPPLQPSAPIDRQNPGGEHPTSQDL